MNVWRVDLDSLGTAACLAYRPAEVSLVGTLTTRVDPGPPNYDDTAKGDAAERSYLLTLERPICVIGDPASELDSERVSDVQEVQLAFSELDPSDLVGRRVHARGSLFAAHTGHHRTPVLLWTTSVSAASEGAR